MIIVGDGLYSKQPFIETVLDKQMHYILVTKPKDHKYLMEWLSAYDELNTLEVVDEKGRKHIYEWMNDVPLNGRDDSLIVNHVSYRIIHKDKVTYKSSWITDILITENNVSKIVKAGRCRWKIENECFNTLKNQGYQIEHNYGHGKKNLCFNFFLLTLIAFFMHQIAELTDCLYKSCRKKFGSKRHLWERLRSYIIIIIYENFEHLLDFALRPKDYKLPYPERIG